MASAPPTASQSRDHARALCAKLLGLHLGSELNPDRPLPRALEGIKKDGMGMCSEVYINRADWDALAAVEVRDSDGSLVFRAKGPPARPHQALHRGYAHKVFWGHMYQTPPGFVASPVCWKTVVFPGQGGGCAPGSGLHQIEEVLHFGAPGCLAKLVRCLDPRPQRYHVELPARMGLFPGPGSPNGYSLHVVPRGKKRMLMPLGMLKVSMHVPRGEGERIEHYKAISKIERREQELLAIAGPLDNCLDGAGRLPPEGPAPGEAAAP